MKGMIMEYVNRAILHMVYAEKQQMRAKAQEQHTYTFVPKRDGLLLLKGRLFDRLIVQPDRDLGTRFSKREFLDAIKLDLGLTDDRMAKDRLNLLIAAGHCIIIDGGRKMTKLIKFKSNYGEAEEEQQQEREQQQASKELDIELAKWADLT